MLIKKLALLFICIGLLTTNVASASMLCCKKNDSTANMQQVDKMDCHKSSDSEKTNSVKQCNDCKLCISSNATNSPKYYQTITISAIKHLIPTNIFKSISQNQIENPPKHIS